MVLTSLALAPAGCLLDEDGSNDATGTSQFSQALSDELCLGPESLERADYDFFAPANIKRNPGESGIAPVVFPAHSPGPGPVYGQFDGNDVMSLFALRNKVTSGTPVADLHRGLDITYHDPNGTDGDSDGEVDHQQAAHGEDVLAVNRRSRATRARPVHRPNPAHVYHHAARFHHGSRLATRTSGRPEHQSLL